MFSTLFNLMYNVIETIVNTVLPVLLFYFKNKCKPGPCGKDQINFDIIGFYDNMCLYRNNTYIIYLYK